MAKLLYKLLITGEINLESGLHIGGSEVDLDIGGIDNEVIKVKQGNNRIPYIPGSSLKGKLRSLLGRYNGWNVKEEDKNEVKSLFEGDRVRYHENGHDRKGNKKWKPEYSNGSPSRLIVRDTYLIDEASIGNLEEKAENTINRSTGTANPRHMERVVKGTSFALDMVLDIYNNDSADNFLKTMDVGFQLLKKDYLGGGGTRGSGKVNLTNLAVKKVVFNKDGSLTETEGFYSFEANKSQS